MVCQPDSERVRKAIGQSGKQAIHLTVSKLKEGGRQAVKPPDRSVGQTVRLELRQSDNPSASRTVRYSGIHIVSQLAR